MQALIFAFAFVFVLAHETQLQRLGKSSSLICIFLFLKNLGLIMLAYKLHARIFGYVTKQCAMTHPLSMELTYELSSDLFGSWQPIKKVECVSKFFVPFTMSE